MKRPSALNRGRVGVVSQDGKGDARRVLLFVRGDGCACKRRCVRFVHLLAGRDDSRSACVLGEIK